MSEDGGETKDDVKIPDGEIGDKINKLFTQEEKDTSKWPHGVEKHTSMWDHATNTL